MQRRANLLVIGAAVARVGWWPLERYAICIPGVLMDFRDPIGAHQAVVFAADAVAQSEPLWPSRVEMPVSIDKSLREPESDDDTFIHWPN